MITQERATPFIDGIQVHLEHEHAHVNGPSKPFFIDLQVYVLAHYTFGG